MDHWLAHFSSIPYEWVLVAVSGTRVETFLLTSPHRAAYFMGETPVAGEHFGSALADLQSSGRSRGFAELVAALNALNNLESSLATAIARARVPVQEVRTLLRAQSAGQAENEPA